MGRKRGFGNGDSSGEDDDFQPSDGDSSPVFSRLKRKRQSSGRDRSATSSASGHGSGSLAEGNKQEEENEVICIPDSLDEDDEKEVEETPVSKDPKIPWRSAKETDSADDDEPAAEDDPVESEDEDAAKPEDENRSEHSDENEARAPEKKPRRTSTANQTRLADSDSESEPEPSEDDDDVYKSDEDSPDESDVESDFAPSPVKPSRKPKAKEKPVSRQPASKPKKAKVAPVHKPLRNVNNIVKAHLDKRNETRPLSTGSGKKRLGARIPSKLSSLGKSPGTAVQRPRPSTPGKSAGTVYRAGLSRNVSIPRLHSYLHKS